MILPLDGIRVLDFTWVISGPQATQVLADFGAEVIKVEWPHHLDQLRVRVQPQDAADPSSPEWSGLWNNLNRNKRSITLNMRHPEALAIALDLVSACDVVVDNFSPGTLADWGLTWERMTAANPRLVHLAMSGFGATGPNRDYAVFAPVMQAISGLHTMVGLPGREPAGYGFSVSDHVGGFYGAISVLAALHERDATGKPVQIDLSQVEASIALTGPVLLDWQLNGAAYAPPGNVPPGSGDAPAGLYPCAGPDAWCAITVRCDAHWRALSEAMGRPELTTGRFATSRSRAAQREAVDDAVAAWTRTLPRDTIVAVLAAAGVPCSPMEMAQELIEGDNALWRRGYFQYADHPVAGRRLFQMGGIASPFGPELQRAAPVVGEANDYVYGDILGLSEDARRAYHDDVVV